MPWPISRTLYQLTHIGSACVSLEPEKVQGEKKRHLCKEHCLLTSSKHLIHFLPFWGQCQKLKLSGIKWQQLDLEPCNGQATDRGKWKLNLFYSHQQHKAPAGQHAQSSAAELPLPFWMNGHARFACVGHASLWRHRSGTDHWKLWISLLEGGEEFCCVGCEHNYLSLKWALFNQFTIC